MHGTHDFKVLLICGQYLNRTTYTSWNINKYEHRPTAVTEAGNGYARNFMQGTANKDDWKWKNDKEGAAEMF